MSILIIAPNRDENIWKKSFIDYDPNIKVFNSRDSFDDESIDCVVVWNHPQGVLKKYKNLKLIYSMGAGVDHVFNDSELPEDIPICKIVDDRLSFSMSNYIIMAILNYHRRFYKYQSDKKNKVWDQESNPEINLKIGILGFGILGKDAAEKLKKLNFDVIGYSLNKKEEKEIDVYFGNEIDLFLSKINVLVCTVPYTKSTNSLLNKDLFHKLKTPTYLINVSRGKVHVEKDILDGIESGKLTGAFLDVFEKEPLPKDSFIWEHDKIQFTPHIASITNVKAVIPQVVKNYKNLLSGNKLINLVNRDKKY
tara:strand:+ start:846 stop:1769 length:924 start_codon:yes stop_codon:yes gene_type:complete